MRRVKPQNPRIDTTSMSGHEPDRVPNLNLPGPLICSFAAELERRKSQRLGSQNPIFPRYSLLWDLHGNRSRCRSRRTNEWEFTLPVISIMRHDSFQGRGTLGPNQLHMYSVCLIQPLGSGIKNPNLGSESCSQRAAWGYRAQKLPSPRLSPSHLIRSRPRLPRRNGRATSFGQGVDRYRKPAFPNIVLALAASISPFASFLPPSPPQAPLFSCLPQHRFAVRKQRGLGVPVRPVEIQPTGTCPSSP